MSGAARSARLLSGWLLASLVLGACGTNGTPALSHFEGEVLSFDYPVAWRHATFEVVSSFSSALVYFSTAPLSDPCDRTANSIACVRSAVSALGPDGVLVEWSRRAWIGWTFDPTLGRRTTVGGRAATLEQLGPSEPCRTIEGERELLVTIDDPTPDQNWTELRACLRGPSLDRTQAQVEAMLATVAWKG